jgi:hypothetical protein
LFKAVLKDVQSIIDSACAKNNNMTIFIFKESARITKHVFPFILILALMHTSALHATNIYTDFSRFWKSSVPNINTILPNKSYNVVGCTYGDVTYSTGVNNALLTQHGIPFTAGNYKTLPFT